MNIDTQGKRLRYVINAVFGGVRENLARKMGVKSSALSDYLTDKKTIGGITADKLIVAGINPAWVQYGQGDVFADNNAGRELKKKFGEVEENSDNRPRDVDMVSYSSLQQENERLRAQVERLKGGLRESRWTVRVLSTVLQKHGVVVEALSASTRERSGIAYRLVLDVPNSDVHEATDTEDVASDSNQ